MKQRADNRIAGFSLIEVIVGIAVLGLVTVPLCASLVLSVRINEHSRDLMNAQLAASGMVETLMASGIDAGVGGDFAEDAPDVYLMKDTVRPENIAEVRAEKDPAHDWYAVTVTGASNGRIVALSTTIREEGGGGP